MGTKAFTTSWLGKEGYVCLPPPPEWMGGWSVLTSFLDADSISISSEGGAELVATSCFPARRKFAWSSSFRRFDFSRAYKMDHWLDVHYREGFLQGNQNWALRDFHSIVEPLNVNSPKCKNLHGPESSNLVPQPYSLGEQGWLLMIPGNLCWLRLTHTGDCNTIAALRQIVLFCSFNHMKTWVPSHYILCMQWSAWNRMGTPPGDLLAQFEFYNGHHKLISPGGHQANIMNVKLITTGQFWGKL